MADCHIGSWRDPKLKDISTKAFIMAVDTCIKEGVDFVLISGDLFNTSLPGIDSLKEATNKFRELKDKGIAVYVIPGSHDFSPSGKTMLDVLEKAGLFVNVVKGEEVDGKLKLKFTVDEKTGAKITGMLGKRGMLEKKYYDKLIKEDLENEEGYKIFMFHSALNEFKPKDLEHVDTYSVSLLPKNFNYYAGGHVHYVFDRNVEGYGLITYPGPLFPNSFKELEELKKGGFYIVEDGKLDWKPIQVYGVHSIKIDCNNKTAEEIYDELLEETKDREFVDTIVTIRLFGVLKNGKPRDIDFKDIFSKFYDKQAYFVMKNTTKLATKEFEEIKIEKKSVDDIEIDLIKEHLGQIKLKDLDIDKEKELTRNLMKVLSLEKDEGERVFDFEKRVSEEVDKVLEEDKII